MVEDPWQRLLQPRGSARCNTYMNSKRGIEGRVWVYDGDLEGEVRGEIKGPVKEVREGRVVGLEERVVVAIRVVTKGGSSGGGGHVGQLVVIG